MTNPAALPALGEPLSVKLSRTDQLRPNPQHTRTHSKRQVKALAKSIQSFGLRNAIRVDENGMILAGHGIWEAAKMLGLELVPTICLSNLTRDEKSAFAIADNKLAELSAWNVEVLAIELEHFLSLEDFEVSVTGFEVAEIDLILNRNDRPEPDPDDQFQVGQSVTVSTTDDLWRLGKHKLLCGNSLVASSFELLLGKKKAHVVFTDPPYNVQIDGNAIGKGAIHHREFAMASGEMSEYEFTSFLRTCLNLLAKNSLDGSVHFIFIDWRHLGELLTAGRQVYDELLNLCIWVKNNGGMGSFYRSQHELVFVFRNGKSNNQNNIQLGKFGRNRTNVWEYPGVNTFSKQGDEGNLLAIHPTVKPVTLVADAILDCSAPGDIVLDCFLGSGTTLMAAERTGRVCYGMEIDPQYVDVAIRRWQKHTGGEAVHVASGKTFNRVEAEKKGDGDVQA
jgi:DNA modification methylase